MKQQIKWWWLISILLCSLAGSLGCATSFAIRSAEESIRKNFPPPMVKDKITTIVESKHVLPEYPGQVVLVGVNNLYLLSGNEAVLKLAHAGIDFEYVNNKPQQYYPNIPPLLVEKDRVHGEWLLGYDRTALKQDLQNLQAAGFNETKHTYQLSIPIDGSIHPRNTLANQLIAQSNHPIDIHFYDPENAEIPFGTLLGNHLLVSGALLADIAIAPFNVPILIIFPSTLNIVGDYFGRY